LRFRLTTTIPVNLLKSWPNLEFLFLPTSQTDEWVAAAVTRPSIIHLRAYRTDITDSSLVLLEKMPQLRVLSVTENRNLTEAAIQRFAAAVPGCRIQYGSSNKKFQQIIEPRTLPPAKAPIGANPDQDHQ
jgi:hypothetical protein